MIEQKLQKCVDDINEIAAKADRLVAINKLLDRSNPLEERLFIVNLKQLKVYIQELKGIKVPSRKILRLVK